MLNMMIKYDWMIIKMSSVQCVVVVDRIVLMFNLNPEWIITISHRWLQMSLNDDNEHEGKEMIKMSTIDCKLLHMLANGESQSDMVIVIVLNYK